MHHCLRGMDALRASPMSRSFPSFIFVLSGDLSVGHHLTGTFDSRYSLYAIRRLFLNRTDYPPPPSMRSLELPFWPVFYVPPLHGVASQQLRSSLELTASAKEQSI